MRPLVLLVLLRLSCGKDSPDAVGPDAGEVAVPVRLATAKRAPFDDMVVAPGVTDALAQHKLKAPFAGRLMRLRVLDGARVVKGEVVAELLSQESDAALAGAEAMARSARTEAQKADGERALGLARGSQVTRVLHAPVTGFVLSHGASEGDLVAAGDTLLELADPSAIVFVAQVVQSDLSRIRVAQPATVELPSLPRPVTGSVQALLPAASAASLAQPVRIGLQTRLAAVGLFGTARIVVGRHPDAIAVPQEAVLRDDISGTSQLASVDAGHRAHWVKVRPGLSQSGWVELVDPPIQPGQQVVVAGQVGLPEGAQVVPLP